jgi:hypothetical protein
MSCSIQQTPSEMLDWTINWATRGLGNDTIASSSWAVSSNVVTLSSPSYTTTTTTTWLTGGMAGNVYSITNTILTSGGREMQETINYICIPQRIIGG